jgi:hypothetical protein
MPRIRRNYGLGDLAPAEGRGELVQPERRYGGPGAFPMGTREHEHDLPSQFEPIRNGVPFVAYDPTDPGYQAAKAKRARSPQYRHARLALDRAQARYGPRPNTIRGLPADQYAAPKRYRKKRAA